MTKIDNEITVGPQPAESEIAELQELGIKCSGTIAIVGHTPQSEVLDLGHLICLDTGCAYGGKLTAMEVKSGEVWHEGSDRTVVRLR